MTIEATIRDYVGRRFNRGELLRRLAQLGVPEDRAVVIADLLDHAAAEPGPPPDPATAPRALSPHERRTVEAMAARILPTTTTPGAIEAGAVDYIDIALARAYAHVVGDYRDGVAALDRHCTAAFGIRFADLNAEQQDTVLEAMERDEIADFESAGQFFELVRAHVMEGMFCEPFYGGNRDLIGWKLVGFPGMRYGYDESYVDKPIELAPVATGNHPPRKEQR